MKQNQTLSAELYDFLKGLQDAGRLSKREWEKAKKLATKVSNLDDTFKTVN